MTLMVDAGLKLRKINIGAGAHWQQDGWDVLDNGIGDYSPEWKHKGKCWQTGLPSGAYDIVFCSHMLEHIPHFRLERTIAEFNRILKPGGTLRVLVPDIKQAARAYVDGDVSYFSGSKHFSDHLGIGGAFVRTLISPGQQTLAMSREMDELIGSYAHLYGFDDEMLKIVLEKWGFGEVAVSTPGGSPIEELRQFQHLVHDGKIYDMKDSFVVAGEYRKSGRTWHFAGFDKRSKKQVVIEAKKVAEERYSFDREYSFNKAARFEGRRDRLKLAAFRIVSRAIDGAYNLARCLGLLRLVRR